MMIHPDFVAKLHNGSKVQMRVPVSFGVYGLGGVDGSGWSLWGGMRWGFRAGVHAVDGIVGFSVTSQ